MKDELEKFVGKRIIIVFGGHPWKGYTGEAIKVELMKAIREWGLIIELDNGMKTTIFNPNFIREV